MRHPLQSLSIALLLSLTVVLAGCTNSDPEPTGMSGVEDGMDGMDDDDAGHGDGMDTEGPYDAGYDGGLEQAGDCMINAEAEAEAAYVVIVCLQDGENRAGTEGCDPEWGRRFDILLPDDFDGSADIRLYGDGTLLYGKTHTEGGSVSWADWDFPAGAQGPYQMWLDLEDWDAKGDAEEAVTGQFRCDSRYPTLP